TAESQTVVRPSSLTYVRPTLEEKPSEMAEASAAPATASETSSVEPALPAHWGDGNDTELSTEQQLQETVHAVLPVRDARRNGLLAGWHWRLVALAITVVAVIGAAAASVLLRRGDSTHIRWDSPATVSTLVHNTRDVPLTPGPGAA